MSPLRVMPSRRPATVALSELRRLSQERQTLQDALTLLSEKTRLLKGALARVEEELQLIERDIAAGARIE
jgi:hypothetical protein